MNFITDLDPVDLRRLREITRRIHARDFPHLPVLTDHQCDVVIETVYPKARAAEAIRAVREAVNRGDFGRCEFSRRPAYTGPVDAFSERARHYQEAEDRDQKTDDDQIDF
ncbi:MAG: hypothetical protein ACE5FR_10790 [Rhodospirillales bacterium]